MVSTTMTAFANLERSNTIIDLLQGPRSAAPIQLKAGVVQSIEAINKKLPTLLPMLVMSDKVEERGLVSIWIVLHMYQRASTACAS